MNLRFPTLVLGIFALPFLAVAADVPLITLGGEVGAADKASLNRFRSAPYDSLAWIRADLTGEKASESDDAGWDHILFRPFKNYSGDISGRFIEIMAMNARGDSNVHPAFKELLAELPTHQRQGGYFAASGLIDWQQPIDHKDIYKSTMMPALWGNARLLCGLVEASRSFPNDAPLLATARKLGDFYVGMIPRFTDPARMSEYKGGDTYAAGYVTCYFPAMEGLVKLHTLTGERKYLEAAVTMAAFYKQFDRVPIDHAHGMLCNQVSLVLLYEATKDVSYLERVKKRWDDLVTGGYINPAGGIMEQCKVKFGRDEGCAIADWLRLNLALGRVTGNARYWSMAERTLHNHFLQNQTPKGGFGHRGSLCDHEGVYGFKDSIEEAVWCCTFHGQLGFVNLRSHLLNRTAAELTCYFPLDFTAKYADGSVISEMRPVAAVGEVLRQRILLEGLPATALRVRQPDWANAVTALAADGTTLELETKDGYSITAKSVSEATFIYAGGIYAEDRRCKRLPAGPVAGEAYVIGYGPKLLAGEGHPAPTWPTTLEALKAQGLEPFPAALRDKECYFVNRISAPPALELANIRITASQSRANNGLIQGNGDLVSTLYSEPNSIILDLTKNDVYDARIDTSTDPDLLTINVPNHSWSRTPNLPPSWDKPFPGPARCARVSIDFPEFMTAKLDLKRAVASINNGDVTVRSLAQSNVYEIHTTRNVTVAPVVGAGLAAPVTGQTDEVAWITQVLPADATGDWPGMNFAVASAHANSRHTIAVVSSLESANPLQDAIALVRATQLATEQSVITTHETVWQDFWSKSSIKIAEQELSNIWYQNLYFSRCVSKPGAQAVGLFAGPMLDAGGWHDNYTLNYNFQQTFWGNIITNHVEMVEPFTRVFERYMPRARWFANETYGFEGAYFPHNLYRHEPVDPTTCVSNNNRMFAGGPWAYTLGNSGYAIHNTWLSYKYQPDPVHLAQHVYPIVKDVGRFYINFVDHCALDGNGKAILGPSVSPEHGDLGIDNCPYDIAFVQFTLKALIEGATELCTDAALVADAQRVLSLLPPHPTSGGVVVDRQGGTPFEYNIPVPITPVFPAEQVTWFSPAAEKTLFTNTLNNISTNGNNSMIMLAVARARLSTPDAMTWLKNAALVRMKPNRCLNLNTTGAFNSFGNYTEQFAISGAISELLLQSVGDILRILPAWPANLDAEFTNLRAQGGFLVSATKTDGTLTALSITSTAGKTLKLLAPWNTVSVNGQPVAIDGAGIVTVNTTPGQNLTFSPD